MLGHKQITTTQIYAQTTPIMIEDAIDRVESRLGFDTYSVIMD